VHRCHGFAQVARRRPGPDAARTPGARRLSAAPSGRANVAAGAPLSPDYVSVDYSRQLLLGIRRALDAGAATLPSGLNERRREAARPVAKKIPAITREGDEPTSDP
jgi:hypothetical protein